ncbi:MAG: hypothetical protein P8X73_12775 [Ignavibacteriaceae bacterium]
MTVKTILVYILFILVSAVNYSQSIRDTVLTGKISYHSAENIFVKFESTTGIEKGDTLYLLENHKLIPVLKVKFVSSKSLSAIALNGNNVISGDEVYALVTVSNDKLNGSVETNVVLTADVDKEVKELLNNYKVKKIVVPELNGRITLQSYSNFTNQGRIYEYQRWRYAFKLDAKNIGGTQLSYFQYINFAYKTSEWGDITSNLGQAVRVYNLALKYDFSAPTSLIVGRHISKKVSNLGPVDGLQFETGFSKFSVGIFIGSRPNLSDMGYNSKLFEYGIYLSRSDDFGRGGMDNTLGYFEQTNDFKTDRRFLYFQHSSSAIKNVRIFLSTEIDLFKQINGQSENELSLTSLFVSANIRPSKAFTFYLSYDARKNVMYYETFKNFIDSVFENETRQGFRTRITLKPVRNLFIGANYGYRFRKGDLKASDNYGGYITYSMIPFIETGLTLTLSQLNSSYVGGKIWGLRLYKDISWGLGLSLGYRNTKYQFSQSIDDVTQESVSFSINTILLNPVYINLTYEGVFQNAKSSGRILIDLSYRF